MFSRTLLFRQILSGLKRFQMDKSCKIPHLSGLKRFLTDNLYFESLVRKICPFYGQTRHRGLPAQPIFFRSHVSVNGYSR